MPEPTSKRPRRARIHVRGDPRLDAVLDFVAFAARPMPLVTLLDEAPRRIASVVSAEVCSFYLLEGDGQELVMRGNVGFASTALGQVRLAVGEGITGLAVEYLRPISTDAADHHAAYKYFAELGEERFPVFLAVPIVGKAGPVGAVAVQRAEPAFSGADVELLTVMGALVAAAIRHAELIDASRERAATHRRAGGGTRKVTLTGRPVIAGRALGALAALRRPSARPSDRRATKEEIAEDQRRLGAAFEVGERAVRALRDRAVTLALDDAAFLDTYLGFFGDYRFRERAMELVAQGNGLSYALGTVARHVARTAAAVTRDAFLEGRARDMEDLCDALVMLAAIDRRVTLPSKALLIGDQLTVYDLLVSARTHPAGVVLSERSDGPRTRALLALLGVPAMVDVHGLFRWASDGDVALVDADHGLLVINPTKGEVASLRQHKKTSASMAPAQDEPSDVE